MKLKELRTRKYVALMMMIVVVGAIVGILKIGNMDFDKGKVKVSKAVINNVTSSLSANINEAAVDNLITSKGYDEIDYVIKYSLSTDENIKERDVIIEASLDDNEKYASFKDITNGDVTSTVSENRKNIKITVKNAKVNKENELKLVMKLEGAPNGYKATPKIKIKEVSEEKYTNLNVQNVEVKNNSLTGNVQDKQSMNVSNIELALKKDGEIIKKTYTDENGNYVFSDIEEGEYNLEIDEDIYEKVSEEKVNISGSSKLNIIVKEVTPYKIELKKQITEMTIVNGGNTTTYKYGNLDKVQQALRNVKNMTGEVKYKITVQNTGKKSGIVTVVKDEVPEGLTFNKEKNTSWEEKNGVLYNRSLEGITLNAGEKREEGLTLDIESTSEAKTYINKVTAKGEIYENIVYILDGKTYKEDTVLEGEKIKEPKVDNKNFKGWYTDKKYTNKYNFNNEVTKDLVLYGQTEEIKEYTVTYVDNEKIVKTEKVKENGSLNAPKVSKEGYTFKYWSEEPNGKEYDLSTKVTKDITLYSVYEINKYTVTFINEKEKYDEQEIEYGENIKVPTSPSKEYYTFKYWSLEENGDSYDLSTKVTKDITLYSVYDINKYTVTFIDKGKEIDKQELEAGSLVIAPKVSMEGYTFKYWSKKENGKEYNLNLPITRNLTLYSVYEINKYNVEFYDSNKLIKTIKVDYDNTINSNEVPTVSKTGYTFTGWIENNKNFDFTTKIKENKKLYSKYEIIKNAVIFNDENRITTKKVDYNNKVEKIESQGKIGYTFKYWSTTQDGEEFDFNTLITEGITLYAVYDINEYSVNFIDQGNAYGDTQKVKYNKIAVKPETDPIKEGYTFKYWSLDENGVAYDFNTKITKDTTLYSVYSVNSYKVSFVDNGTKYIEDETIEYNKVAVKPETDPSKEGHTFKYWSLEENGVAYDFNAKITKDITLYSVYSVNNYKVSFIDNGTKYIEDETIEYNKVAIKPETDPSKVGHTFKYWSLGENGTAYDFSTKITKDTTLYSVYEANEYTVKFMDGDNLFKQEQVKYGLKATKPSENPTKEHNLFKTWTLNDKEYDFNLPVIDNMILRSSYEEIEKPSISHVPTEWTNNKVTVTITSSHEDYKYLYKIDTGEYKEYTGPFDIDYNCTVVAKSVKENVDSITESHDITNIDKIKPIINSLNETNVSGTSFDINVSTIDNESGMKQIHIYKDDLLETTIVYNENYNEEKNSTYTFNDLVSGKDYKIKVIAEDVAGNLSEAKEITVKTEEKIVARIIGRENKLFEDENLYENFSSLERAIKACPSNQCTIEMVTDTKESVEVLEGQDITLNINGKTITGVKDTYTINNGGNLIIKDNAEEAGSIVNNAGVALKNETTGVLTLGELEDELVVSTTKPYINGGTFGVVNEYIDKNTKGRFNFYDGMIAGNIAIEGEVNDKPYLYNASVVTSDNRQVATLKILEDAEARIVRTGVYYTKVNEAMEDTNKGTISEPTTTNTTLMQGFTNIDGFEFVYDNESNTLSSKQGKSAKAYTVIDLTGYENDQYLNITDKEISGSSDSFKIIVKENDINGTSVTQTKTSDYNTSKDNYKFYLSKGKKYYVRLSYNVSSSNSNEIVTIYDISLQKINKYSINENTEFKTISNSYGFEYDKTTRTLKSNNQFQSGTTAFSYMEVDLTNANEDKEVIINASLDTLYYNNYGNIVINEDNTKLSNYSYNELACMYSSSSSQSHVGPYNYSKTLTKGKKYYIQFYYFKSNYDSYSEDYYKEHNSKDQFIINTIDIVGLGNKQDIDLSANLKTNSYGFNNYSSYYERYTAQSNVPSGEKFDSYVKVDLTKSNVDQIIDLNLVLSDCSSIYITSNNKDSEKSLIIDNTNNTLLSYNSSSYYYINGDSSRYNLTDYKYVLPKGSVYYVHFASYSSSGIPSSAIKSISLTPVTDNMVNIGTLPHLKGTIDDSSASSNNDYVIDDGTSDSNFRFIGKNTKNYVKFNDELWRVIGIFNTTDSDGNYAKRIKIVRNDSIGSGIVWDSSSSGVNNGNGVNEWSQAAVMKLLNPGYDNNKVIHDSGSEIVTNNSLYWNRVSGKCLSSGGLSTSSCDFTSIGLNDSAKSMIDSVLWNTGAITSDTQSITPNQMYTYERGDKNGKTDFDASNYPTVDSVERTTTWLGKVGLPYPSDYIMASGDGSGNDRNKCMNSNSSTYGDCSSNNNWMGVNVSAPLMTMSPIYGASFPSFTGAIISSLYTMPAVSNYYVLKPTVYLSPKVKITSGSGTQNSPFILELGKENNTTLYYGLVPSLIDSGNKDEETEIKDEDETLDYTYVKNEPAYGFTYDKERGIFTNENKGISNTVATSYIKIDLTSASSDMPVDINYNISKNDYSSMGFINLMKNNLTKINYNNSSSYNQNCLIATSNKSTSDTIKTTLEKGNIYYLQFAYKKDGTLPVSDTNKDSFEVSITYTNDEDKTNDYIKYDSAKPILNKEVDTIQILKNLSLSDTLNIENTRNVTLDLNGHTLTTSTENAVINNEGSLTIVDSKYTPLQNIVEKNNEAISKKFDEESESLNKKYQDEYNAANSATIDNIVQDGLKMNLSSTDSGDSDVYWKNLANTDENISLLSESSDKNGYFKVDGSYVFGSSYIQLGTQNYNNKFTFEFTILPNGSSGSFSIGSNEKVFGFSVSGNYLYYTIDGKTTSLIKKYVNEKQSYSVSYDGSKLKIYFNGKLIKELNISASLDFSTGISGSASVYSIRSYTRALSDSEIKTNYNVDNKLYGIEDVRLNKLETKSISNSKFLCSNCTLSNNKVTLESSYRVEKAYVTSSLPIDFDSSYQSINGSISVLRPNKFSRAYISISLESADGSIGAIKKFEYKNYYINETLNYDLKPAKKGSYFLKIYVELASETENLNFNINAITETVTSPTLKSDVTHSGIVYSTTGNVINNTLDATLNVDSGLISSRKGNSIGIVNNGKVLVGKHGVIESIGGGYNELSILNGASGEMLDSDGGLIKGTTKFESLTASNVRGYKFGSISNYNETELTFDNVDVGCLYNYSKNNVYIINSNLKYNGSTSKNVNIDNSIINDFTNYGSGSVRINNSEVKTKIKTEKLYITNSIINSFEFYTSKNYPSLSLDNTIVENLSDLTVPKNTYFYLKNENFQKISIINNGTIHFGDKIYVKEVTNNNRMYVNSSTFTGNISNKNTFNSSDSKIIGAYNNISNKTGRFNTENTYGTIKNTDITGLVKNSAILNVENVKIYKKNKFNVETAQTSVYDYSDIGITNSGNLTVNSGLNIIGHYLGIKNSGTIDFNDKVNISDCNTAIENTNTINAVTNFKINNCNIGIKSSKGTVTLGTNNAVIDNSIVIDSIKNGLLLSADTIFNYYDGIVKGEKGKSFVARIYDSPANYDINFENKDEKEVASLIVEQNKGYVAEVNGAKYKNLNSAFDAVENGNEQTEVKLLDDIYTISSATITEGKKIKINFNNHLINYYNNSSMITNNGELELYGKENDDINGLIYGNTFVTNNGVLNYENTKIISRSGISKIFENNGTMNFNSGEIKEEELVSSNSNTSVVSDYSFIKNNNILNVNGGTFNNNSKQAIYSSTNATVNVFDGSFEKSNIGISSDGTLTIKNGKFSNLSTVLKTGTNGVTSVTGGDYNTSNNLFVNNSGTTNVINMNVNVTTLFNNSGDLNFEKGTYTYSTATSSNGNITLNDCIATAKKIIINSSKTNININKGSYTTSEQGLILATSGETNIIDSKIIQAETSSYYKYAAIKLTGGTALNSTNTNVTAIDYAINSTSTGDINIISGNYSSSKNTAILNTGANTITFGTKGDKNENDELNVSITNPEVSGKIGIKTGENTIFNFYDGVFKGTTPIDGSVSDIEEGYAVYKDGDSKYLKLISVAKNLTTNSEYIDLNSAFEEANSGDTIQVIHEITTLKNTKTIDIPENKKLILDINGFKVIQNNDLFIRNSGTLTLTNGKYNEESPSTDDGYIYNSGTTLMFENSGNLNIKNIYIQDSTSGDIIKNNLDSIVNIEKTVIKDINEGTVINNSGTVNLNNSTINTDYTAIINNGVIKSEYSKWNNNNTTENSIQFINNSGELTFNNDTINTKKGFISNSSILNIIKSEVSSYYRAPSSEKSTFNYFNLNGGKVTVSDSNISKSIYTYASDFKEYKNLFEIGDSVEIEMTNTNVSYGSGIPFEFSGESSKLKMTGGKISGGEISVLDKGSKNEINLKDLAVSSSNTSIKLSGSDGKSTFTNITDSSSSTNFLSTGGSNTVKLKDLSLNKTIYGSGNIDLDNVTISVDITLSGGVINLNNSNIKDIIDGGYGYFGIYRPGKMSIVSSTVGRVSANSITVKSGNLGNSESYEFYMDGGVAGSITTDTAVIVSGTTNSITADTVTLGVKGDKNEDDSLKVSTTDPKINGYISEQTVKNGLDMYFYDGVVKGRLGFNTSSNSYVPKEVEAGYNLKTTSDGTYLVNTSVIKNLTTNKEYYDMKSAIDEVSNNDTLKFIDSVSIYKNFAETKTINEGMKITLDLNNQKVFIPEMKFINNGTIDVIDSSEQGLGTITSSSNLENNGTINVIKGHIPINNLSTVNVEGGILSGKNSSDAKVIQKSGAINNFSNQGTVQVEDGQIDYFTNYGNLIVNKASSSSKIENTGTGTANINNLLGTAVISTSSWANTTLKSSTVKSIKSECYGGNFSVIDSTVTGLINSLNKSNITITGNSSIGSIENSATVTLGEKDGIVNTNTPVVNSEIVNTGTFNYYDGKIISTSNIISGTITDIEPGYKLSISDDTTNNKKIGYLVPISDDERVAMVNGINFTSLQTAINSVKDNTESNIVIYKDIELTEDIIVPENKIINLYLNGYTITYGDYSFVKNGTLTIIDSAPSESIGASIINTIEKVLNINQNGKNIIVYEMSDGSKLSTENTYNLYKKVDNEYKLLNMEKDEEVGRYITGSNNSEMTSIKGRIYLNNLEEGSYKLVSSDNKDIEFTITEDGKLNGNILENTNEKRKVIETAFAYLIITIQTGVNQIKYIIYIVAIVSIILGLYFAFKEQRKLSRKV